MPDNESLMIASFAMALMSIPGFIVALMVCLLFHLSIGWLFPLTLGATFVGAILLPFLLPDNE